MKRSDLKDYSFMSRMEKEHLHKLWITRMTLLEGRQPRWILETVPILLFLLLITALMVDFKRQALIWLGAWYGGYLLGSLTILAAIYRSKHRKKVRQYSMLLYAAYDSVSAGCLSIWFMLTGILSLGWFLKKDYGEYEAIQAGILAYFFLLVALNILFSKRILIWKLTWISNRSKPSRHLGIALSILAAAPGVGILISKLLVSTSEFTYEAFLITMLMFFLASILIVFTITSSYDVFLMATNRWPKVRKVKSEYVVIDDYDGKT